MLVHVRALWHPPLLDRHSFTSTHEFAHVCIWHQQNVTTAGQAKFTRSAACTNLCSPWHHRLYNRPDSCRMFGHPACLYTFARCGIRRYLSGTRSRLQKQLRARTFRMKNSHIPRNNQEFLKYQVIQTCAARGSVVCPASRTVTACPASLGVGTRAPRVAPAVACQALVHI